MINNIHMKSCATYNKSGASLMNCKKINFIYGANGSGKSTISNFLLQQENPCLLDGVDDVYDRLETDPEQFPVSRDAFLAKRGYHESVVPQMDYVIVFDIRSDIVNVVGVFHQLENYQRKV